jgi:hypothetical protein
MLVLKNGQTISKYMHYITFHFFYKLQSGFIHHIHNMIFTCDKKILNLNILENPRKLNLSKGVT